MHIIRPGEDSRTAPDTTVQIIGAANEMTATGGAPSDFDAQAYVQEVRDYLGRSKTGALLLQWADEHNVKILPDHQLTDKLVGLYLNAPNAVLLNANMPHERVAVFLGHEIRHAWQNANGLLPQTMDIPASDMIIRTRLMEADAHAVHTLIAAELELDAGDNGPMTQLKASENQGEIARAFEKIYLQSKDSGLQAMARLEGTAAAFNAFMMGDVRKKYDRRTVEFHAAALQKAVGIDASQFDRIMAAESPLAVKLNEEAAKHNDPFKNTDRVLSAGVDYNNPDDFNRLSVLPDGTRYMPEFKDTAYLGFKPAFGLSEGFGRDHLQMSQDIDKMRSVLTDRFQTKKTSLQQSKRMKMVHLQRRR